MTKKKKHVGLTAFIALLLLVAVFAIIWQFYQQPAPELPVEKHVNIQIDHADGTSNIISSHTKTTYLYELLLEENLVEDTGETSNVFLTTIDGYTADGANGEWWVFTRNGEYVETSVDTTALQNGDLFVFSIYEG